MPTNRPPTNSTKKEHIQFPEVEDIFHATESPRPETEPANEKGERGESGKPQEETRATSMEKISENAAGVSVPMVAPVVAKSPLVAAIESIMEENLQEIYHRMPDEAKEQFRVEGEKTANEIQALFQSLKATTKAILELIRKWLKFIPGINKFFLEQEAKIKADKIMAINPHTNHRHTQK